MKNSRKPSIDKQYYYAKINIVGTVQKWKKFKGKNEKTDVQISRILMIVHDWANWANLLWTWSENCTMTTISISTYTYVNKC